MVAGIVFGILVLLYFCLMGYWTFLLVKYPEPTYADEMHTVTTGDIWKIRLYRRRPRSRKGEPVLLLHGAGGNHLSFELPHGQALADVLAGRGFDVWLLDVRGCRSGEPAFGRSKARVTIDDYLIHDLPATLAYIRKITRSPQVHWVGHSLGGMLLYAYELAFGAEWIASGATLGSPPGFKGMNWKKHSVVVAALRLLGRSLVEGTLRALAPLTPWLRPQLRELPVNYDNLHPACGPGTFVHALDMTPPLVARELDRWAAEGVWRMAGGQLDVQGNLDKLRLPLLLLYGAGDPFVPLDQAQAFFNALPANDKEMRILGKEYGCVADYSHIDLTFAANGRDEVYGPIADWLEAHPIKKSELTDKALEAMTIPRHVRTWDREPSQAVGDETKHARGKTGTASKTKEKARTKSPAKANPASKTSGRKSKAGPAKKKAAKRPKTAPKRRPSPPENEG